MKSSVGFDLLLESQGVKMSLTLAKILVFQSVSEHDVSKMPNLR